MLTSWDHLGISSNRFFELPGSQDLSNASYFFIFPVSGLVLNLFIASLKYVARFEQVFLCGCSVRARVE